MHWLLQGITQVLDPMAGRAENLAEFSIANTVQGSLNILGTVSPTQAAELQATRVDVEFTAFDLQLGPIKTTVPLGWVKPKVGQHICNSMLHLQISSYTTASHILSGIAGW